jgi:hypothetical protein
MLYKFGRSNCLMPLQFLTLDAMWTQVREKHLPLQRIQLQFQETK